MDVSFPFYSRSIENDAQRVYHTHTRCRVAQSIAVDARVMGTGDDQQECPFCFLLGNFEANRMSRDGSVSSTAVGDCQIRTHIE
jgi:hypothetical protein